MDYYQHIEEYIEGTLSDSERVAFENAMRQDPGLDKAVTHFYDARRISEGFLELDILETLEGVATEQRNEYPTSGWIRRWWPWIAAGLGLIFLAWWFVKNTGEKARHQEVLALYTKPIDDMATKSIDTTGMSAFEKGKFFFALNRFEDSEYWIRHYLDHEKNQKLRSVGHFWLGAAHIEQNEFDKALHAFKQSDEAAAKRNIELIENK